MATVWKKETNNMAEYINGEPTGNTMPLPSKVGIKDGYKFNNWLGMKQGTKEDLDLIIESFLNTGKFPSSLVLTKKAESNLEKDLKTFLLKNDIDYDQYKKEKILETERESEEFNPYVRYLEEERRKTEEKERGFLDEQTRAQQQNADILAQQNIMQQSQFKDQLVEQIKSDRLTKMRSGLTPMQIAQEELQFAVGNMQLNNEQIQMANQQRLTTAQQKALNPYQAHINAMQNITGGQGLTNFASGMAATDAGDLERQASRYKESTGVPFYESYLMAQGRAKEKG